MYSNLLCKENYKSILSWSNSEKCLFIVLPKDMIVFMLRSEISLEAYHLGCEYTVYQGFSVESHLVDLNYLKWFVLPVLQRLDQSLERGKKEKKKKYYFFSFYSFQSSFPHPYHLATKTR